MIFGHLKSNGPKVNLANVKVERQKVKMERRFSKVESEVQFTVFKNALFTCEYTSSHFSHL